MPSLAPDDFQVGQMIAVLNHKTIPQDGWSEDAPSPPQKYPDMAGLVMEVRAISLPFLAVRMGNRNLALDTRQFSVIKVSDEYAKAMGMLAEAQGQAQSQFRSRRKPRLKRCPCGTRMVEVAPNTWLCPNCGGSGDLVPAGGPAADD